MLYVVATPIGNLGDLSPRAKELLGQVDLIAAEDTRRTGRLLQLAGIQSRARLLAYHDHNESTRLPRLLEDLVQGRSVALVSDAGTPLLSDPGYRLVLGAAEAGVKVVPVPGPCAAIAALSVGGLPCERFVFEGFLPGRSGERRARLQELRRESRTLVFYEAPHRILATLRDMAEVLGPQRRVVLARELTKLHETVLRADLDTLSRVVEQDPQQQLGECVLLVEGGSDDEDAERDLRLDRMLTTLLQRMPLREAVACAVEISGLARNAVYRRALQFTGDREQPSQ